MRMFSCDSSYINSYGYDEDSRTLQIEFKNGAMYKYGSVPPEVFIEFVRSESKGKFFLAEIKDKYTYERV